MFKAAFLDRDGVINRKAPEGAYITRWEDMVFLSGVVEGIQALRKAGFRIIVISNQRCVAKGLLTASDLEALNRRMCETLAAQGAVIDAAYFCPHDYDPPCKCRKPAPGLLLDAADDYQIDLKESWMIGDSAIDMAAGRSAGCKTALVQGPEGSTDELVDLVTRSLLEAAQQILKYEEGRRFCTCVASS